MNSIIRRIIQSAMNTLAVSIHVASIPLLFVIALCCRFKERNLLIWGAVPVSNYMYWSEAMRSAGHQSETLMTHRYAINKKDDFDRYIEDLLPLFLRGDGRFCRWVLTTIGPLFGAAYVLRFARGFHTSFAGGPLGATAIWRFEPILLHFANIKTVVIPIGSDAFKYSTISDTSLRHVLLSNYPFLSTQENRIAKAVDVWTRYADIIIVDWMMDGIGRWDVTVPSVLAIDVGAWSAKQSYSANNGTDGPVRVLHSPNHRYFKGSEFLIKAVEDLCSEGLQVELVLLEGVPNETVRSEMLRVDILAEQFVFMGYGLSAVEGFASGLPVMSNLSDGFYTRVFRRYAFLNECPTLSTSIEEIKDNLRLLVTNPDLREELGRASRTYAEKYHSYSAAVRLFELIYRRIFDGEDVDIQNMFHPIKGVYGRMEPMIQTRLVENKLP